MDAEYPYRPDAPRPDPDELTDDELRRLCLFLERRKESLKRAISDGTFELGLVMRALGEATCRLAVRVLAVDHGFPCHYKRSPKGLAEDFGHISAALAECGWDRARAADMLGMDGRTLYRRIRDMKAAGWTIPERFRRRRAVRALVAVQGGKDGRSV